MVLPMAAKKSCLSACPPRHSLNQSKNLRLLGMHSLKIISFPSFFHLVFYAPALHLPFILTGSSSPSLYLAKLLSIHSQSRIQIKKWHDFSPTLNIGGKRHHNECSQRDDRILGQSISRLGRRSRKPRLHKAPSLQELFCVTGIM